MGGGFTGMAQPAEVYLFDGLRKGVIETLHPILASKAITKAGVRYVDKNKDGRNTDGDKNHNDNDTDSKGGSIARNINSSNLFEDSVIISEAARAESTY